MTYTRRVLHYGPGPTDFKSLVSDRAIAGCWFELHRQGGCGAGELQLRDEFPQRTQIEIGDWIAFEADVDQRWYLGRVEQRTAHSPARITFRLEGMGVELGEVFPGGFGADVGDGAPPHRYANTDLFPYDPDRAAETVDSVTRADELVALLISQYVVPRTHITFDPSLIQAAPDDSLTSAKFRGEESVRAILKELAVRARDAAWGVRADGKFFFQQRPATLLATYREGVHLLSLEESRDLELLFNRVVLTGDYVYDQPLDSAGTYRGFFRWRGNYVQPASRDRYGERRIRIWIPWIRSRDDSRAFITEFFRVYAQPTSRFLIEVAGQSDLPLPWGGVIRLEARDGTELITAPIETIRVQFDHTPRFRLELGPEDPRTHWPEPAHDERWELPRIDDERNPGGDVITFPLDDSESTPDSELSYDSSSVSGSSLSGDSLSGDSDNNSGTTGSSSLDSFSSSDASSADDSSLSSSVATSSDVGNTNSDDSIGTDVSSNLDSTNSSVASSADSSSSSNSFASSSDSSSSISDESSLDSSSLSSSADSSSAVSSSDEPPPTNTCSHCSGGTMAARFHIVGLDGALGNGNTIDGADCLDRYAAYAWDVFHVSNCAALSASGHLTLLINSVSVSLHVECMDDPGAGLYSTYTVAKGDWDCKSPLTLHLTVPHPWCSNWPATLVIEPF